MIAEQISGRRKAKEKIPTYYEAQDIIYPPGKNLEQTSSELTAKFKSSLVLRFQESIFKSSASNRVGVDLTGGFGIDTCFLSKMFSTFCYVEPNLNLLQIAKHNHQQVGAANISYHHSSALHFLDQPLSAPFDFAFIDPSRRNENKKVFTFHHSEPNITQLQQKIFQKTDTLLIKASPLLDIKLGLKELLFVKTVFVVAVGNEVKELLFYCEKGFLDEPFIEAVTITGNGEETFRFLFSEETQSEVAYSDPLSYLYEPNPSILKAGAFKIISNRFNFFKIQSNTHLYTSDTLSNNFPGRIFNIEAFVKPDLEILRFFFNDGKANVITRNYPLSVAGFKKKTGLTDGGDKYLIAFSGLKQKYVCVATRLV